MFLQLIIIIIILHFKRLKSSSRKYKGDYRNKNELVYMCLL